MRNLLYFRRRSFNRNHQEKGQGLVEYALILGFVALVVFTVINVLEFSVEDLFSRIAGNAPVAPPSLLSYTPPPTYTPTPTVDPLATNTPVPTATDPAKPPTATPGQPTLTHTPTSTATPTCTGYAGYALPGRVQMENFICGRSAVAFADSTGDGGPGSGSYRSDVSTEGPDLAATTGGYYMGWLTNGEWVKYDVLVNASQLYDITFRAASTNSNGKFRLELINNGQVVHTTSSINVPNSGGTQTWINVTISGVPFVQGSNQINVIVENGGFNLDYFDAVKAAVSPTATVPGTATPIPTPTTVPNYTRFNYIRLVGDSEVNGNEWTSVAELNLLDGAGVVVNRSPWSISFVDSAETGGENAPASNAIDGNSNSIWHTEWDSTSPIHPHDLQIKLGQTSSISGFKYLPRQNQANGRIANYRFCASVDGSTWYLLSTGTFPNTRNEQTVRFTPVTSLSGLPSCVVTLAPRTLINVDFDSNADGFTYKSGAFAASGQKDEGAYGNSYGRDNTGGLRVNLGNQKDDGARSGGWQSPSFTLTNASAITIQFAYSLVNNGLEQSQGECSQVLVKIENASNQVVGSKIVQSCTSSNIAWKTDIFETNTTLASGTYTFTIGGHLTKTNNNTESAMIYIDNVLVKTK